MRTVKPFHLIYFAVIYLVIVIALAQLLTPPEYNWTKNTISELAAQKVPFQWVMQTGFIGFGLLMGAGLLWWAIAHKQWRLADLGVFGWGLAILLAGVFSAAPYIEGVSYSIREAELHSLFATAAGISLTIGIFFHIFYASDGQKFPHIIAVVLVGAISGLFGLAESGLIPLGKGLMQRLLWLIGFVWLFWAYREKSSQSIDHLPPQYPPA